MTLVENAGADVSNGKRDPWERGLILILFGLFFGLAALPILMIPVHVSRNYNEGWNAYQTMIAMSGGALYPPMDALTTNNYPPLSFYIVGSLGTIIGDYIVAGRIISLLGLLLTSWNVFRLSRWLGADRSLATLGAGWFLLAIYTLRPGYIAMDDPQFLAHALVSSGTTLFLFARRKKLNRDLWLSAGLVVAAGLVKHNVIALPLAFCTWSAFHDRARLRQFLFAAVCIGTIALGLFQLKWGPLFLENVLLHARRTSWEKSAAMANQVSPFLSGYFVATLAGCYLNRRDNRSTLIMSYLIWSLATGYWWLSGAGVSYSILFDLIMALALGIVFLCAAVSRISKPESAFPIRRSLVALLTLSLVGFNLHDRRHPFAADVDTLIHRQDWLQLNDQLTRAKGPVACEILALCYWAQQPFEIDLFNYQEKLDTGRVDPSLFRDLIERKYFAYIVLEKNTLEGAQLPQEWLDMLQSRYRAIRLIDGHAVLFQPTS